MHYPSFDNHLTRNFTNNSPFIFLAEDDIDDQELLIDALNSHNDHVNVQTASNGKKAITILENLPDENLPCLIILDYNLPEINGSQILQNLAGNERYQSIPKIVWSTSNSQLYRQLCLDLGARAYFVKPSDVVGIERLAKQMLQFCDTISN